MTKTGLSGWRAAHSITFCRCRAGPRVTILSRNLAAGSAFAMRGGCLGGLDHQTHGGKHGTVLATKSALNLDGTQLHLEPGQMAVPHGLDRSLDVYEVVHESGGVPAAAASG